MLDQIELDERKAELSEARREVEEERRGRKDQAERARELERQIRHERVAGSAHESAHRHVLTVAI